MFDQITNNLTVLNPALVAALLVFVAFLFVGLSILYFFRQHQDKAKKRLQSGVAVSDSHSTRKKSFVIRSFELIGNYVSHGRASTNLWDQLVRAGYMSKGAPAIYTGVKMLFFLLGVIISAILVLPSDLSMSQKVWFVTIGGVLPFFLPNVFIRLQENKRCKEVQQNLPDVVDLLEICVSSGVGLDMAWNMVAKEVHQVSSVLGTAMDLTNFEMHLGASRAEAMRNMAKRTGADQLSSLATILVQSERFGTSIALALREFAVSMREDREMSAEEEAEKMPVKLLFPMVFFIFPSIFIVTIGPAVISIINTFSVMGR